MEEVKNNREIFQKTVDEYNAKYGYAFVLPEGTDYTSKYAHPEFETKKYKLRGQIDENSTTIYGIDIVSNELNIDVDNGVTKKELDKVISSDTYKERLRYLALLKRLNSDMIDKINWVKSTVMYDSLKESERDELYDTMSRAVKQLYRGE